MQPTIALLLTMISLGVHAQAAPGASFRDCTECPEMVMIPGGEFTMGAAPDEEVREHLPQEFRNRSAPQRRIHIQGFAAGKFEVTRSQYRVFAEATGRDDAGCFVWSGGDYRMDQQKSWRSPGYAQDDTHPVTCVSWNDADAYVRWLSQRTGKHYRLLTEAEWEYTARSGSSASRFWGDDVSRSCGHANGADLKTVSTVAEAANWPAVTCNDDHAHTAPAGSFRANAFGLYDMLGNAAEWTADCWNVNYRGAPVDGRAWIDGDCFLRVVRGGAWDEGPATLRSAYRVGSPVVVRVYARGFRVARQP